MEAIDQALFNPQERIGDKGEYLVLHQVDGHRQLWSVRGPSGECDLYAYTLPRLRELSISGQEREKRAISRELDRWRQVIVARPTWFDHFWRGDTLCWIERRIAGAPLSSLTTPLSLYEGISLIEECLCALDLIHAERDLQMGEPLLHLNLNPDHIWRSREGGLILLAPISPTIVERAASDVLSDEEALSGERAPELSRGRYGMSTDLYAIGMSALSAMTGMSLARVDDRLQAERLFVHDLPCDPLVAEFLSQLTAFRASARFQSAREALIALQALPSLEPLESDRSSSETSNSREPTTPQVQNLLLEALDPNHPASPSAEVDQEREGLIVKSAQDEKDLFYTLAGESSLGSIAAEQLGLNSCAPPVVVDAQIEAEETYWDKPQLRAAIIGVIALGLIYLFFFPQSSAPRSQEDMQTPAETSQGAPSKNDTLHGVRDPQLTETAPYLSAKKHEVLSPQLNSSPHPEWIKLAAGSVVIGSNGDEGYENERPLHVVQVKAFEVSKTEVTVLQYAQCVAQGICSIEGLKSSDWGDDRLCNWDRVGRADHPLNCVSWYQARVYAQWVGGRLLSESEWSFAAQGGSSERSLYPWGDHTPSCDYAVLADFTRGPGCGAGGTLPVCKRPLGHSKQGVCDLIGNVWEWVMDDWHSSYEGAPLDSRPWVYAEELDWVERDRTYRGGGAFDEQDLPRIARRGGRSPSARLFNLGFRVARD